jgi:uncharacterized protein (TIGR03435 family)
LGLDGTRYYAVRYYVMRNRGRFPLAALAIAAACGWFITGSMQAQSGAQRAFEVASIRQRVLAGQQQIRRPWSSTIQCPPPLSCGISGTRFSEEAASLTDLLMDAYAVQRFQISGLPSWGDSGRDVYDIAAKVAGDEAPTLDQVRRMLQTLLAERFKLELHHAVREVSVYALVLGKNGSKLKPAQDVCGAPGPGRGGDSGPAAFLFAWERLPEMLSQFAGRPVIDETGLKGRYCTADGQEAVLAVTTPAMGRGGESRPGNAGPDADPGGEIFSAVEQKLGLKLEPRRAPVDVLIIDHVERPSAN